MLTSPEQMTADWFELVLTKAGVLDGGRVTSVAIEPITGGAIARMVRASLTFGGELGAAPRSVVVKYPTDDPGSLGVAKAMGLYELEVRFYQDIAPLVPGMSIPTCYLAEIDEESRFVLVLEDFGGRAKPGDVFTPSTIDECADTLEQLVKFQAPLWNSPTVAEMEWIANPARTHGVFDLLAQGLPALLARFGDKLEAEHVRLFESVLPRAGEWVRSWASPTIVQHGDFRSDNTLLGTTPGTSPVTVIDFQTVRVGPPGIDPAHFLGSALPTPTRREAERDLITEYHRKLLAAGVEAWTFDDCWAAYREGAMYPVFLFVGMAAQVESTERGDRLIVDQIRRYADMAIDLDSPKAAGLA
jgi:hypothetical protein